MKKVLSKVAKGAGKYEGTVWFHELSDEGTCTVLYSNCVQHDLSTGLDQCSLLSNVSCSLCRNIV